MLGQVGSAQLADVVETANASSSANKTFLPLFMNWRSYARPEPPLAVFRRNSPTQIRTAHRPFFGHPVKEKIATPGGYVAALLQMLSPLDELRQSAVAYQ